MFHPNPFIDYFRTHGLDHAVVESAVKDAADVSDLERRLVAAMTAAGAQFDPLNMHLMFTRARNGSRVLDDINAARKAMGAAEYTV